MLKPSEADLRLIAQLQIAYDAIEEWQEQCGDTDTDRDVFDRLCECKLGIERLMYVLDPEQIDKELAEYHEERRWFRWAKKMMRRMRCHK